MIIGYSKLPIQFDKYCNSEISRMPLAQLCSIRINAHISDKKSNNARGRISKQLINLQY